MYSLPCHVSLSLSRHLSLSLSLSLCPIPFPWPPSRSVPSADQTSLDRSERASLDSKASTEASVASGENAPGEVAIGNLIDIEGNVAVKTMFLLSSTPSPPSSPLACNFKILALDNNYMSAQYKLWMFV